MAEYCDYLNRQHITIDDERIEDLHLQRKFKDWKEDGSFLFGGRSSHPYMGLSKAKRSRIKINGQTTVGCDYPASVPNILYQELTGRRLYPEDPYQVDGIPRTIAKEYMNRMLNTFSKQSASMAIGKWLNNDAKKVELGAHEKAIQQHGSRMAIMDAIAKRNEPIRPCFFRGDAVGQHYAWLEANLVFEVARYAVNWEIPALTVHDEFIVAEENEDGMNELLYTVGLDERVYDGDYLTKAIR